MEVRIAEAIIGSAKKHRVDVGKSENILREADKDLSWSQNSHDRGWACLVKEQTFLM